LLGKIARTNLFVILAACALACPAVEAQRKPNTAPLPEKIVTSPRTLPDFPQYTGQARYIVGSATDNHGTGTGFRQRWHMKEGKSAIINWYRTALSNAGWNMRGSSKDNVNAKNRAGNMVSIYVNEVPLPDNFKSETVIIYYEKNELKNR